MSETVAGVSHVSRRKREAQIARATPDIMASSLGGPAAAPDPEDELPLWAHAVFPNGLSRISNSVWTLGDGPWNVAEQALRNLRSQHRSGGGAAAARHFQGLLGAAAQHAGLDPRAEGVILDLQCGDGDRSVRPWLSLLPMAHLVATDCASLPLAGMVNQLGADSDRVLAVVAEPDELAVADGSVDVVSGVNCLQEMDDPDLAIAAAATALRSGGVAIFTLPFDGHGVLRLAFERILAEARLWPEAPLPVAVEAALAGLAADISARTMPDRADPGFANLHQKWLFSREAIEAAARMFGFRNVAFIPHHDHETLFRDFAQIKLEIASADDKAILPGWASSILEDFDRALRPPVKRLLMLEGTTVLTK